MKEVLSTPIRRLAFLVGFAGALYGAWWQYHKEPPGKFFPPLAYTFVKPTGGGVLFLPAPEGSAEALQTDGSPEYDFDFLGRGPYRFGDPINCPSGFDFGNPLPPHGIRELGLSVCNAAEAPVEQLEAMRPVVRQVAWYHYRRFARRILAIPFFAALFGLSAAISLLAAAGLVQWVQSGKMKK